MHIRLLDGLRGYFLLIMTAAHIGSLFDNRLYKFSHVTWDLIDVAEGFVFLAGLVIAIAYVPRIAKRGHDWAKATLNGRLRVIFSYHLACTLIMGTLVYFGRGQTDIAQVSGMNDRVVLGTLMTALMLSGSYIVDILPMYVVFVAATPLILRQLDRGNTIAVLFTSAGLWVIAQTQITAYVLMETNAFLGLTAESGLRLGLSFDRTAWQLFYVTGLTIGYHWVKGNVTLDAFRGPQARYVAVCSLVLLLCFMFLREHQGDAKRLFPGLIGGLDKWDVGVVRLANFATDAYLFTWLMVAGADSRRIILRWISVTIRWLLQTEPLCLLGRYSLQVYTYHVIVTYVLLVAIDRSTVSAEWQFIYSTLGIFSIWPAALLYARFNRWQRDRQISGMPHQTPAVPPR